MHENACNYISLKKHGKISRAIILALLITNKLWSQQGKAATISIEAGALNSNLLDKPHRQPLTIYLPTSYGNFSDRKHQVVYFLAGFKDTLSAITPGCLNELDFGVSMNRAAKGGTMSEVIVVLVHCIDQSGVCFHNNSPVTGNWDKFVTRGVVRYIDCNYRTLKQAESRA